MQVISRRTTVVVAAAALAVATSGGVALAHGRGHGHGASPARGAEVHSVSVLRTATGFVTRASQYGSVTAVSPTSLAVVSADGYDATYVLDDTTAYGRHQTVSSLAVGDTVRVSAVVAGGTSTATVVLEKVAKPVATATATPVANG